MHKQRTLRYLAQNLTTPPSDDELVKLTDWKKNNARNPKLYRYGTCINADIAKTEPTKWLNSAIIRTYLHLLTKCDEELHTDPSEQTQFVEGISKNAEYGWKINDKTKQLIAVFNIYGCHWVTIIVNYSKKYIWFCDSYPSDFDSKPLVHKILERVIKHNKMNRTRRNWAIDYNKQVPRQTNGYDCGVFALMCAQAAWLDLELSENTYGMRNVLDFRLKIAVSVLRDKIKTKDREPFEIPEGERPRTRRRDSSSGTRRKKNDAAIVDVTGDSAASRKKNKRATSSGTRRKKKFADVVDLTNDDDDDSTDFTNDDSTDFTNDDAIDLTNDDAIDDAIDLTNDDTADAIDLTNDDTADAIDLTNDDTADAIDLTNDDTASSTDNNAIGLTKDNAIDLTNDDSADAAAGAAASRKKNRRATSSGTRRKKKGATVKKRKHRG